MLQISDKYLFFVNDECDEWMYVWNIEKYIWGNVYWIRVEKCIIKKGELDSYSIVQEIDRRFFENPWKKKVIKLINL